MLPHEYIFKEIQKEFGHIERMVKQQYANGDTTISFIAELFVEELLNAVLSLRDGREYKLRNLNYKKKHHPAVDLGDKWNRISVQVTITNDKSRLKQKVDSTISQFVEKGLQSDYDKVYVFVVTGFEKADISSYINNALPDKYFNKNHIWDLTTIKKIIVGLSSAVVEEQILPIIKRLPNRPEQPKYPGLENYIERTVTQEEDKEKIFEERVNQALGLQKKLTINDFLLSGAQRYFVLMNHGGEGKSVYLKQLASEVCAERNELRILLNLNMFRADLKTLISNACTNWENHRADGDIFLILDGLDEAPEPEPVLKEINELLEKDERLRVIVSCRPNVFPKAWLKNDEVIQPKVIRLTNLSEKEVYEYYREYLGEQLKGSFYKAINEHALQPLLSIPFYLIGIVEIYKKERTLPKSKADVFEKLVSLRQRNEEDKLEIGQALEDNELDIDEALKRCGLMMQLMRKTVIENTELQRIVTNKDIRKLAGRTFIKKENSFNTTWEFEHKHFQEYYAARALAELNWNEIKELICIKELNYFRPSWINAVGFYFGMLDEGDENLTQLTNWLAEHARDVLIRMEPDKVTKSIRDKIFDFIFQEFSIKDEPLWDDRYGYSLKELAAFVDIDNNNQLVKRLLQFFMDNNNDNDKRLDIMAFLSLRSHMADFKEEIQTVYLNEIQEWALEKNVSIVSLAFKCLTDWKIESKALVKYIWKLLRDKSYKTWRLPAYRYLLAIKFSEYPALFIAEGIKLVLQKSAFYEYKVVEQLIESIDKKEVLFQLLEELLKENVNFRRNEGVIDNNRYIIIFTAIAESSCRVVGCDDHTYPVIYSKLIEKVSKEFYGKQRVNIVKELGKYIKQYESLNSIPFLKNTLVEACKKSEYTRNRFDVPALLFEEPHLVCLKEAYKEKIFKRNDIFDFYSALQWLNPELSEKIGNDYNNALGNIFVDKPNLKYIKEDDLKELEQKIIIDYKCYCDCIETCLSLFEREVITSGDSLRILYSQQSELSVMSEVVKEHIDILVRPGNDWTKTDIRSTVKTEEYWKKYSINTHLKSLKDDLPMQNKNWLKEWCKNIEHKLPNGIIGNDDIVSIELLRNWLTIANYLNHKIGEAVFVTVLKNLRLFTPIGEGIEDKEVWKMVVENLGKKQVSEIINSLLRSEIDDALALQEYTRLIEKYELVDTISSFVPYLTNKEVAYHIRISFFGVYRLLNGSYTSEFLNILEEEQSQQVWILIQHLSSYSEDDVKRELLKLKKKEGTDQYELAIALVKNFPIDAIEVFIEELKLRITPFDNGFQAWGSFFREIDVSKFHNERIIQKLLEVISVYTMPDFKHADRDITILQIMEVLHKIVEREPSKPLYNEIRKQMMEILNGSGNAQSSKFIKEAVDEFDKKCQISMDVGILFSKAVRRTNQLLPCN